MTTNHKRALFLALILTTHGLGLVFILLALATHPWRRTT